MRIAPLVLVLMIGFTSVGCSTAPETPQERAHLRSEVGLTLKEFQKLRPSTYKSYMKSASGYAVFPEIGKGGIGIGGAYGKGVLYERGKLAGYCKMEEINIGFQLGGQEQSMILFFENKAALARFKTGELAGDASASAVVADADASAEADFKNGVATYIFDSAGAMYQATVGGKRFKFVPKEAYDY